MYICIYIYIYIYFPKRKVIYMYYVSYQYGVFRLRCPIMSHSE